eukprot:10764434-Karenia_brevis.AAC.1
MSGAFEHKRKRFAAAKHRCFQARVDVGVIDKAGTVIRENNPGTPSTRKLSSSLEGACATAPTASVAGGATTIVGVGRHNTSAFVDVGTSTALDAMVTNA